ncbi:FG-GAP repeat domain-containing protein [Saccharopolyspora sp. CA-218241]|uniref:FG-GAP repeat domain-containing protein n=1 Tax=Saccharopolyspora sp. CA-218241 TaxID=3240027 RepID=UPI003D957855
MLAIATARPDTTASAATASSFSFRTEALNSAPADARYERPVQPQLEHIRSWISAVGAAVALTDLRGLGHQADVCLVDPRDDSVTVFPVRGSEPAYERFELFPRGLRYDATMAPMGCVPADLDENGTMDFLIYYWGRSPVLFLNGTTPGSPPRATDFRPTELVRPMEVWNSTSLNVADVDGDGHLDVLVGNYFPDGAKVLDPTAHDDDRMAMQDSMGLARNGGINRIFLTRPTGAPMTAPSWST